MHLVDSLGKNNHIEPICCLHEQAVVIAADAYSQYTNNIGAALVTTGPGSTNAITGVAGSWIDSIPVIIISGQVKRGDLMTGRGVRQMGAQEVDIVSMVKNITKYATVVIEPELIRYHLEKAVFLAGDGRPGPVWIDIPLDVQGTQIDETTLKKFEPEEIKQSSKNNNKVKSAVTKTLELLNASNRPVLLAGNGVRLAKATQSFGELIAKLAIPLQTTWKGIDLLPEDHPLFFGRPGCIASRYANFVQQNSDLFIAIGARLDFGQAGYDHKAFAPKAKKVIVDVDKNEIDKLKMSIDLPVYADAGQFIDECLNQISVVENTDRSGWLEICRNWKKKYPVILPEYKTAGRYANTYYFIDILSDMLDENDILVPGSSGSCSEITLQAFRVKSGQRIFNNPGLGSMGYGLPASIGACIASNKKRTITIIGDGGLQHNIQELANVAYRSLPLKIFILNNNGYASIRMTQTRYFDSHFVCCDPDSGLPIPQLGRIAQAYDIPYIQVSSNSELQEKVKEALNTSGPVLCELFIDPVLPTMPKLSSEVKSDGQIVSKPLEDLWPFLDRDEFESNML